MIGPREADGSYKIRTIRDVKGKNVRGFVSFLPVSAISTACHYLWASFVWLLKAIQIATIFGWRALISIAPYVWRGLVGLLRIALWIFSRPFVMLWRVLKRPDVKNFVRYSTIEIVSGPSA